MFVERQKPPTILTTASLMHSTKQAAISVTELRDSISTNDRGHEDKKLLF